MCILFVYLCMDSRIGGFFSFFSLVTLLYLLMVTLLLSIHWLIRLAALVVVFTNGLCVCV